jgi:hypothetical protein
MIGKVQRVCVCCGARLPDEKRETLIQRGCGTNCGDGGILWHCPHHKPEEVIRMAGAVPKFSTGKDYRKYATENKDDERL